METVLLLINNLHRWKFHNMQFMGCDIVIKVIVIDLTFLQFDDFFHLS